MEINNDNHRRENEGEREITHRFLLCCQWALHTSFGSL
jgi:hypothetical protein